jgi:hypothetical protein
MISPHATAAPTAQAVASYSSSRGVAVAFNANLAAMALLSLCCAIVGYSISIPEF